MVDVLVSRKSVRRALLVVSLLLCGPQVQAGDQPAAPSFWDSFRSYTQPIVTDYLQPAAGYWVDAARSYPGSSLQNAPLVSNSWGNPLMPTPEIQIAAPPVQPVAAPLPVPPMYPDSSFGTWHGERHERPSSSTAGIVSSSGQSTPNASDLSAASQQAISQPNATQPTPTPAPSSYAQRASNLAQRTAYSAYSALPAKAQVFLASLGFLGTAYVAKLYAASTHFSRILARYNEIMDQFVEVKDDGSKKILKQPIDPQELIKLIRLDNARDYGLKSLPAIYGSFPMVGFIENLTKTINDLYASPVLYGTPTYKNMEIMKTVLNAVKDFIIVDDFYEKQRQEYEQAARKNELAILQKKLAKLQQNKAQQKTQAK